MLSCINFVQEINVLRLPTTNRASDLREGVLDIKRLWTTLRAGSSATLESLEIIEYERWQRWSCGTRSEYVITWYQQYYEKSRLSLLTSRATFNPPKSTVLHPKVAHLALGPHYLGAAGVLATPMPITIYSVDKPWLPLGLDLLLYTFAVHCQYVIKHSN